VLLQAVGVLAMIGVLFTMPQYFQGVLGTDPMGSGLRLLPLVGGLIVGAVPAAQIARRAGAKLTAAAGFCVLAGGLALGTLTGIQSGELFVAVWMALVGVGMGVSMATSAAAALIDIPEERSGVGSAVMQAVNKTGGPLGSAILGSALTAAYLSHLQLSGLPAPAAATIRRSIFGGVAVAAQLHSPALLHSVRVAFMHGLDQALFISAAIALTGAILAVLFLPRTNSSTTVAQESERKDTQLVEAH